MRKLRSDSWASAFESLDKAWECYERTRAMPWWDATQWAVKEYSLPREPKRSAWFAWRSQMQEGEHRRLIEKSLIAQEQQKEIAEKYGISDETHIKALMSAATNATILTGNPELARELVETAMEIKDKAIKAKLAEIEERKVEVKEEVAQIAKRRLEIAEDKERRAKGVIADAKLTPEEREAKIKEIFGL